MTKLSVCFQVKNIYKKVVINSHKHNLYIYGLITLILIHTRSYYGRTYIYKLVIIFRVVFPNLEQSLKAKEVLNSWLSLNLVLIFA